jgi:hypothetical protein
MPCPGSLAALVRRGSCLLCAAATALAVGAVPSEAAAAGDAVAASALKAAFLYNFAKFADWSQLPPGAPVVLCAVGGDAIVAALVETVRGQNIGGHTLAVSRPQEDNTWRSCQLLYLAEAEIQRSASGLNGIRMLPVLTVSDRKGFAAAGGIIELYLEHGRMRFAINLDAAERAGVRLSSRLLALAKVIRDTHAQ